MPRGRPATRHNEAAMFELWRMVRREVDLMGARSIRDACDRIMGRHRVRFLDLDKREADRVTAPAAAAKSRPGELLRQRYQAAEQARQQPERFPILAQRCAHYLEGITLERVRQAHWSRVYALMERDGQAPDGSTLTPAESYRLAVEGIYLPRVKMVRKFDRRKNDLPKPL